MLRISDGRMSGTAGGTIVLHISPESAHPDSVFGVVKNGDVVEFDLDQRVLRVDVSDEELARRVEARRDQIEGQETSCEANAAPWATKKKMRGYRGLYMRSVNQAEDGADFDFLTAAGPA
jgi:dihydroxy-acid dehydratase